MYRSEILVALQREIQVQTICKNEMFFFWLRKCRKVSTNLCSLFIPSRAVPLWGEDSTRAVGLKCVEGSACEGVIWRCPARLRTFSSISWVLMITSARSPCEFCVLKWPGEIVCHVTSTQKHDQWEGLEISKISKYFLTATFGVPCTWEEYAEGSIERVKLFAIEGVVLCADGERIPTGFALKIPLGQDGGAALITQGLAASLRGVQQGLQAQDLLRAVGLSGSLAGLGFFRGVCEECKKC